MIFSSNIFLYILLPLTLALTALCPKRWANAILLAVSLFFYAWGEAGYVVVMLACIAFNYGFGLLLERVKNERAAGWVIALAIAANVALLGYYKYANFFVDNLNVALGWVGFAPLALEPVHLPLGISFFTFRILTYVIGVYFEEFPAERNPLRLALFTSFFPVLIAGPIVRYGDMAPELEKRSVDLELFAGGVRRFIIGLGKKVLIANTLGVCADEVFAIPGHGLTAGLAWTGAVCYTLQIYFDFSGYSDMAIGIGRMLGFHFMENFNYPYISRSITEFWRRWHISLSSWFRDYVFMPLQMAWREWLIRGTVAAVMVTFLLTGVWHGAAWTFVLWGVYHGALIVVERLTGLEKKKGWGERIGALRHVYAILAITLGWVLFRSESLAQAGAMLGAMVGLGRGDGIEYHTALYLNGKVLTVLVVGVVFSMPILPWVREARERWAKASSAADPLVGLALWLYEAGGVAAHGLIFLACAMSMAAGTHNPFIYFRF